MRIPAPSFSFLGCRSGREPKYNTPRGNGWDIIRVPRAACGTELLFFTPRSLQLVFPWTRVYPRAIIMSVIAIVQRALPFSLPWKRRQSTSKEKDPELKSPDQESHEEPPPGNQSAEHPCTTVHCDVSDAVHIAVRQAPDQTTNPDASSSETDSGSESEYQARRLPDGRACARGQLSRAVSWASIVRNHCRWTKEQEKQLVIAEKQLKRCQKAWSSEQEVWLAYVRVPCLIRWLL